MGRSAHRGRRRDPPAVRLAWGQVDFEPDAAAEAAVVDAEAVGDRAQEVEAAAGRLVRIRRLQRPVEDEAGAAVCDFDVQAVLGQVRAQRDLLALALGAVGDRVRDQLADKQADVEGALLVGLQLLEGLEREPCTPDGLRLRDGAQLQPYSGWRGETSSEALGFLTRRLPRRLCGRAGLGASPVTAPRRLEFRSLRAAGCEAAFGKNRRMVKLCGAAAAAILVAAQGVSARSAAVGCGPEAGKRIDVTRDYRFTLLIGRVEDMYMPYQVRANHLKHGEVMLRGAMATGANVTGGMIRHLEVQICARDTRGVVTNANPRIVVEDTTRGRAVRLPVSVMEGIGEGAADLHYGNNVAMAAGHRFVVVVTWKGERESFKFALPRARHH